jgi:HJR/Mrr/RecB family endonuclease
MLNGAGDIGADEFDVREVAPPGSAGLQPRRLQFDDVLKMQPRYFEAYVAALWSRDGFGQVTLTPASGDAGVDVVALRGDEGVLVQCKTSLSEGRELGWEAIKDVVTGEAAYKLRYPGVTFQKVCVTTQRFNPGAREHARHNRVRLVDREALKEIHGNHDLCFEDVDQVLYSNPAR